VVVKKEDGVLHRVRDDVDLPAVDERILPADADPDRVAGSGDSVRPLLANLVRHGNDPDRRCGLLPEIIDVPEGDVAEDPVTAAGEGGFDRFRHGKRGIPVDDDVGVKRADGEKFRPHRGAGSEEQENKGQDAQGGTSREAG